MSEETQGQEKIFIVLTGIGAIFGFLIPLILYFLKTDNFSDYTKKFITDITNFELTLFVVMFILCFIPVLGWGINIILSIVNLVVVIRALIASQGQKEYGIPFKFDMLK